jgi:protein-disulfide isomerase
MNFSAGRLFGGVTCGLMMGGLALAAQSAAQPTLQQQVDALREGQRRLESELAEIKALLRERGGRSEVPIAGKPPSDLTVNVYGEPFKGQSKARVAIMEYSDFDCSFCAKYATEIYPKIEAAYVKSGQVKYFFRDLPMQEHPTAFLKANIARCAGEQDRFWEAHDLLFKEQKTLSGNELSRLIQTLGLEGSSFTNCVGSEKYGAIIRRSAQSAERMKIRGTPAFLVGKLNEDGSMLQVTKVFFGAESFEAFKKVLDEVLAPAAPK